MKNNYELINNLNEVKSVAEKIDELNNLDNCDFNIATAYFSLGGFEILYPKIKNSSNVKLLLGSEPRESEYKLRSLLKNERVDLNQIEISNLLGRLTTDINLTSSEKSNIDNIKTFIEWIEKENVEVKILKKNFLHGKAYFSTKLNYTILGSSNMTTGGFLKNIELNIYADDKNITKETNDWFQFYWDQAEDFKDYLIDLYQQKVSLIDPKIIFLRTLYEKYGELQIEKPSDDLKSIELTEFQRDGVTRALEIMNKYGGVVIADSVGLGKSILGLGIIKPYFNRRQEILLIVPKSLEKMWKKYLRTERVVASVVSYEKFRNNIQSGSNKIDDVDLEKFSLVIVDEGHRFRNLGTQQEEAFRIFLNVLEGRKKKDVAFLTATPVNNSVLDLYNLFSYFINNDSEFASQGIPSIKSKFDEANSMNVDDLSTDFLFDIIDNLVIRRTRTFIKKYYENDTIFDPFLQKSVIIKFPKPVVNSIEYQVNDSLNNFFDEVAYALNYDNDYVDHDFKNRLTLTRYTPSLFLNKEFKNEEALFQENGIAGILRNTILKRFESSTVAFINTLKKMRDNNKFFLDALINEDIVLTTKGVEEYQNFLSFSDTDSEASDFENLLTNISKDEYESANYYEKKLIEEYVKNDIDVLTKLIDKASEINLKIDEKLKSLISELEKIVRNGVSKNESNDLDKDKVIIFTYFSDTADYIYDKLKDLIKKSDILSERYVQNGDLRLGLVKGGSENKDEIISNFAPKFIDENAADLYDILVSTDVIAEGVNLQQCRNIINYDLPWNPMRLVQRHGRIDRVLSPWEKVYIKCMFPNKNLDNYLNLKSTLDRKLKQAAATIGPETKPIPEAPTSSIIFGLKKEDSKIFEQGDVDGSISGEMFRKEFTKAINEDKSLLTKVKNLTWGSGTILSHEGIKSDKYILTFRVGPDQNPNYFQTRIVEDIKDETPLIGSRDFLDAAKLLMESQNLIHKDIEINHNIAEIINFAKNDIQNQWVKSNEEINNFRIPKPLRDSISIIKKSNNFTTSEVNSLISKLEAPRVNRISNQFRKLLNSFKDQDYKSQADEIKNLVNMLALDEYKKPDNLPRIGPEDIYLINWVKLEKQ